MDRIGVIFGGKSTEHEVSLASAKNVIEALDRTRHKLVMIGITQDGEWRAFEGDPKALTDGSWERMSVPFNPSDLPQVVDLVLPILHGAHGEDGTIQGLFEMLNVAYAGCGVLSSSLCMDKVAAKMVFDAAGIPTCPYVLVQAEDIRTKADQEAARCEKLGYPMFVKPANAGSSVGISKAKDRAGLVAGLKEAAKYDRRVIVEQAVDAREIETGVIGNEHPLAAGVGEIAAANEFYDYEAKYRDDQGTVITVPARVEDSLRERIRDIAVKAYQALDCAGFARVDFLVDRTTGEAFVNEINTIPGFTKYSMFPMLWQQEGVPTGELIEKIVEYGYERHRADNNRETVHR